MDLFRKIFYPIESTVYFILLVLAITTVAGSTHYWDATQATTIIIAAATGMVGIWCPPLVEKLFKLKFSHLIDIIIAVDLFAAVVLGEACTFYYRFQGMDKFFHFFATAELALGEYTLRGNIHHSSSQSLGIGYPDEPSKTPATIQNSKNNKLYRLNPTN